MVLCRRNGYWYLAQRARPESTGVALVATMHMPTETGFSEWKGRMKFGQAHRLDDITFYPEVRYKGVAVFAKCWDYDTEERLVKCLLMPWDAHAAGWTSEMLDRDGWNEAYSRDGCWKSLPLEDLELIEGDAPKGRF